MLLSVRSCYQTGYELLSRNVSCVARESLTQNAMRLVIGEIGLFCRGDTHSRKEEGNDNRLGHQVCRLAFISSEWQQLRL